MTGSFIKVCKKILNPEGIAHDIVNAAQNFLRLEAAGGILLGLAAVVAIIIANSPLFPFYDYVLNGVKFRIGFDDAQGVFSFELKKSLLHWINDGFMTIFFLLVGLEIKREIVSGELSSRDRALLPLLAAVGGMVVPMGIYWLVNRDSPGTMGGWAIPAATDIAFALGVLSLLGSRVPLSVKVLLTAIAVIDDIGAILIIAVFYSHEIAGNPLSIAAAATGFLLLLNIKKVSHVTPYLLAGFVLWAAVLESGLHATLAGVITALFIPVRALNSRGHSPCAELEHGLHPYVAFGILPLFAFANAGVPFTGMGWHSLGEPVTLGIILGLVIGKPLGIFSVIWLAVVAGISPRPKDASWLHLAAMAVLCGIGFTMSLFIGGLAFAGPEMQAPVRLGVLGGSAVSALAGAGLIYFFSPPKARSK